MDFATILENAATLLWPNGTPPPDPEWEAHMAILLHPALYLTSPRGELILFIRDFFHEITQPSLVAVIRALLQPHARPTDLSFHTLPQLSSRRVHRYQQTEQVKLALRPYGASMKVTPSLFADSRWNAETGAYLKLRRLYRFGQQYLPASRIYYVAPYQVEQLWHEYAFTLGTTADKAMTGMLLHPLLLGTLDLPHVSAPAQVLGEDVGSGVLHDVLTLYRGQITLPNFGQLGLRELMLAILTAPALKGIQTPAELNAFIDRQELEREKRGIIQ